METFGEVYRPSRQSPELVEFFGEHEEIDPQKILILPHIPQLLGGTKSGQFIIRAPEATPDTPPDPDATIDLSGVVIEGGQGLRDFADFFEAAEQQAYDQYDAALLETQQVIAEAQERRQATIEIIFIPDTVNSTADDYFRRSVLWLSL